MPAVADVYRARSMSALTDANTDAMDDARSFGSVPVPRLNGHRHKREQPAGTRYRIHRIKQREFTDPYVQKWADAGWTLYMAIPLLPPNNLTYTFVVVWMKGPKVAGTPALNSITAT